MKDRCLESSTTTTFTYDGDQVIAEYDGSNNLLRKFVYGPGIDEPVCMIDVTDDDKVYYYFYDGLGSIAGLSDAVGNLVERYTYDVFGKPTITDSDGVQLGRSDVNNPYMFTGRRYDSESGTYYYRARQYDSTIGRFMQVDPLGYEDGLGIYQYCWNNPIMANDPFGEATYDISIGYFDQGAYYNSDFADEEYHLTAAKKKRDRSWKPSSGKECYPIHAGRTKTKKTKYKCYKPGDCKGKPTGRRVCRTKYRCTWSKNERWRDDIGYNPNFGAYVYRWRYVSRKCTKCK